MSCGGESLLNTRGRKRNMEIKTFRQLMLLLAMLLAVRTALAHQDVHTYSDPRAYQQRHLELDLVTDFAARRLAGTATISFTRGTRADGRLVLDTRDLLIRSVALVDAGTSSLLPFELGKHDPILGRALTIHLPRELPPSFVLAVSYETSPEASGLQWLTPRQTAGGRHPFLFSQSQAIHARSWVPLQDTPAARITFGATISTPPELLAVMSAARVAEASAAGRHVFEMRQAIPSYLLAIAVGELEFGEIGARTGVYAEPEVLESALAEFEDTEKMLEISEALFGAYRWERYDLLILPPSFPYGGMENPRLSFITPTVLAGDKSLVSLIAHELAHSWSGNLVTNANWEEFWLNEGFTTFLEGRITGALYGERQQRMEERLGYESLLEAFGQLEPRFQKLKVELEGVDPDAIFSVVPYEKGRMMLDWLATEFGDQVINAFLTEWFDTNAFGSVTTADFLDHLQNKLLDRHPGKVTMDEVRAWIYEPGLPDNAIIPPTGVFAEVEAARDAWLAGRLKAARIDTGDWSTQDWLFFLNNLPGKLSKRQMKDLDQTFDLTNSSNNEIAHSWLRMAIRNDYRPAWPRLEQYLLSIGRNKLIKPLYEELAKSDEGMRFARRVFEQAKPGYHPQTLAAVMKIVYPAEVGS